MSARHSTMPMASLALNSANDGSWDVIDSDTREVYVSGESYTIASAVQSGLNGGWIDDASEIAEVIESIERTAQS